MKKQDFINYIAQKIDEKQSTYYDDNEQYFYFYSQNFQIKIASNESSSFLIINDKHNYETVSQSFSLTYEETVNLCEKAIAFLPINNVQHLIEDMGETKFLDTIDTFKEYLKNANLDKEIEQFAANQPLDDYVIQFQHNGVEHICNLGRISHYSGKKSHLLTSIVKIPFFVFNDNQENGKYIPYDIVITPWEIKNYPALQHFVEPNIAGTDFSTLFDKMLNSFPHGTQLLQDILSHTVAKSKDSKINKI